ncbi:hypothetical protein V8E36_008834 [Tilletia maclaganii]
MSLSAPCTPSHPILQPSLLRLVFQSQLPTRSTNHLGAYDHEIKGYLNGVFFQRSILLNFHVYWADFRLLLRVYDHDLNGDVLAMSHARASITTLLVLLRARTPQNLLCAVVDLLSVSSTATVSPQAPALILTASSDGPLKSLESIIRALRIIILSLATKSPLRRAGVGVLDAAASDRDGDLDDNLRQQQTRTKHIGAGSIWTFHLRSGRKGTRGLVALNVFGLGVVGVPWFGA